MNIISFYVKRRAVSISIALYAKMDTTEAYIMNISFIPPEHNHLTTPFCQQQQQNTHNNNPPSQTEQINLAQSSSCLTESLKVFHPIIYANCVCIYTAAAQVLQF